jgi:hypothetical protein
MNKTVIFITYEELVCKKGRYDLEPDPELDLDP